MLLTPPGLWGPKEQVPYVISEHSSIQLHKDTASAFGVAFGFLADLAERRPGDASTLSSRQKASPEGHPPPTRTVTQNHCKATQQTVAAIYNPRVNPNTAGFSR